MATRPFSNDDAREFFSAAELADLGLPGLPGDKRSINRRAQEERWSMRIGADGEPLVQIRAGRGGGTEFHVSLLPGEAQIELARQGLCAASPASMVKDQMITAWRWYEGQSGKTKAEAERRAGIIAELEMMQSAGATRVAAISDICGRHQLGQSTVWSWLAMIEGIAASDRLPALAPRRKGGGTPSDIEPLLWTLFKSDYLRPSAPTLTSVYRRVAAKAAELGLSMPSARTFRRKIEKEVDPAIVMLRREGEEALRRSIPAQRRTVAHLQALEHVNVDGHKFDVFVDVGDGKPVRPMMVAIQDIYSSKVLAWRIDLSETAVLTRLAFADLFRNFGIPKACTLDNGRAFASKWITGGAKTRFRFKIKPEDPTGLLVGLGIKVHWAKPYRGQSKPIERSFRDMCDDIAKHPAMEGAYTGNNPLAKPANYGSRAVPFAEFEAHVARGIAAHNARSGRRGRTYRGRSFDDVFGESYTAAQIGKATPEQLRMALLAADQKMVNRQTGEIDLYGNRYWSPECGRLRGTRVTVRFDPDNLNDEVHLYAADGTYLTSAGVVADSGFDDVDSAKKAAKRDSDYRRMVRAAAKMEDLMTAEELADRQADIDSFTLPEPSVIRPVRHVGRVGNTATARKVDLAQAEARESKIFGAIGKLRIVE